MANSIQVLNHAADNIRIRQSLVTPVVLWVVPTSLTFCIQSI